jgi:hypothetical protein
MGKMILLCFYLKIVANLAKLPGITLIESLIVNWTFLPNITVKLLTFPSCTIGLKVYPYS